MRPRLSTTWPPARCMQHQLSLLRCLRCNTTNPGDVLCHVLLPLHSVIRPQQHNAASQMLPPGTCKVVVATNIANTSVTSEDVVYDGLGPPPRTQVLCAAQGQAWGSRSQVTPPLDAGVAGKQ